VDHLCVINNWPQQERKRKYQCPKQQVQACTQPFFCVPLVTHAVKYPKKNLIERPYATKERFLATNGMILMQET